MSTRNAIVSLFLLLAFPVAILAQDASAALQTLQQAIGKELPSKIRVTARGSGYVLGKADSVPQHYGIESYTQELDLKPRTLAERIVAANSSGAATQPPQETHAGTDSPWSTQYRLWITPYGFLTGAIAAGATAAPMTLEGAKYTTVSFTPTGGQPVRGFMNEQNLLERVRTTIQDPARGKVDIEAIYSYWTDFNGRKFPTMLIEKQNGELFRVLVVGKMEAESSGTS